MTKFQALFIKYLRVKLGGSWRWVAAKYEMRYKDKLSFTHESTCGGNPLYGIFLCDNAMVLLNENVEDGWN